MLFMGLFSAPLTLSIQVPTIGAGLGFLGITLVIIGGIYLFKFFLNQKTEKLLQSKSDISKQSSTVRKYEEVGIFQYSGTIYTGGFATALLVCFLAINWTTSETEKIEEIADVELEEKKMELDVPNTPPPPPPPTTIQIDDNVIEKEPDIKPQDEDKQDLEGSKGGVEGGTGEPAPITITDPEPVKVAEPEIFTIVEEQPSFPGCEKITDKTERQKCSDKKMVSFLGQKAGYPSMAREAGFEGTVFIRFVVEPDGSISNIEILKDQTPGGGLKDAALKAVQSMNTMNEKWNPGKQRGNPVRVRVVVPVKFKLQ